MRYFFYFINAVRGHAVTGVRRVLDATLIYSLYMTQQTSLAPLPSGMSSITPAAPSSFVAR